MLCFLDQLENTRDILAGGVDILVFSRGKTYNWDDVACQFAAKCTMTSTVFEANYESSHRAYSNM